MVYKNRVGILGLKSVGTEKAVLPAPSSTVVSSHVCTSPSSAIQLLTVEDTSQNVCAGFDSAAEIEIFDKTWNFEQPRC